ncbi:EF-hand domain-containing protein [Alteriqipengyuania flavescens]|uniref:EF-hand domain-containing protein n=1 Tax=Alteriqipengyuania flavescens TaxID=3053610 RepID=UPI0025B3939D|nr:EF-hand domain-containing protein [Alteriqipengyuania flavescens]WJY18186.1 EF-hand domain-containing protein [Alteriqipengyuania flavescens]WJY24127.1 EF-hand domain-containing protein [Alteriqipengyuania flavescens]
MNRLLLGGILSLLMVGVGLVWWQGRAQVEQEAPPPPEPVETPEPDVLPSADVTDMKGPTPPEATELSREQRRFFRYDRNRDLRITRNEMLSTRTNAFRKLDKDGNNLLTFEEWAVTTADKFDGADANRDGELTQGEFATTAPKRRARPACRC